MVQRKAGNDNRPELGRRSFIKLGGLFGIAAGLGGTTSPAVPATSAESGYPVHDIAPLTEIAPGAEIFFEYPDADSPAVLLRLDHPAEGGIGPNDSIVAFSLLCTHKGCPVQFKPDKGMLICPCHWSSFDATKAGRLIIGQASESLPQVLLRLQDGKVQATGINGLIYGRHTNIL